MAIIQCDKCGKKYSDKAPNCPHCINKKNTGKKDNAEQTEIGTWAGLGIFIVSVVIISFIFLSMSDDDHDKRADKKPVNRLTETQAYIMSQQFVKDRLKAPATADFPWQDEATIRKTGPGEFLVLSYVDAQNAFGANIRNHYACKIRSDDNGKTWNLVEFSFANQ